MTASQITVSASQYSADLAREARGHSPRNTTASERGHSADESAQAPEQDFREAFKRHLNDNSDLLQQAKTTAPPSRKPADVTPANLGQQAATSKVVSEKLRQAPSGSTSAHSTGSGAKQQQAAGSGQQRKTRDTEQTALDGEQSSALPLSASEQPRLSNNRDADDQLATADEYLATSSSGEGVQETAPAINEIGVVTGGLAIAMRIDSPHSVAGEAPRLATAVPGQGVLSNSPSLLRGSASIAASETEQRHEGSVSAITGATAVMEGSTSAQPEKAGSAASSEGTSPADFEAEFAKFRSEPVRGAHVQIDGSNNERVDIRLLERGGALSVSVRSDDATLARALQDHSPELNARLTTEHFRTELWTPDSGKQTPGRTFEDGRGQSQGGSSGEGAPDERQHGRQQNEPAWIEDFENHSTAFQKRIEYTWHQ